MAVFYICALYSPGNFAKDHPRIAHMAFSMPFAQIVLGFQFKQMVHEEMFAFSRTALTCWGLLLANYGHHYYYGELIFPEYNTWVAVLAIGTLSVAHHIYFVTQEIK